MSTARRGMVVAPQPEAVEAGAEALRAGGNAVDAAVACALVQGVVDPMMTGIAGFGSLHLSSMCPSIVFAGDRPFLIIGAPGGAHIAIGVLQAILNVVDFDMSISEAVAAPRFSATSDVIDVSNRIPTFVTCELEAMGYRIGRSPLSYTFAAVHGIRIDGDRWTDGADPGRDGMALAV